MEQNNKNEVSGSQNEIPIVQPESNNLPLDKTDQNVLTASQIPEKKSRRENIDAKTSSLSGIAGFTERLLRRFRDGFHIIALFILYIIASGCIGVASIPGFYLYFYVVSATQTWPRPLYFASVGASIALGYFVYGLCMVFILPLVNFILPVRLKPWKGIVYSIQTVPWYIHNALTYIMRYTFLNFITPTPLNLIFYRLMGMKIGRGVQINTTNISDPCLMELEDKVTIGGSATLICHYASGGFLIIAPVRIKKGATVGLRAIVMGDVEIGEGSRVLPNSVVMPKTRIPAGEIWGGVPAQFIQKVSKDN